MNKVKIDLFIYKTPHIETIYNLTYNLKLLKNINIKNIQKNQPPQNV